MEQLKIIGGTCLSGDVVISGSKNAALPLLCASMLADGPCHFSNVPNLADVRLIIQLLSLMGCHCTVASKDDEVVSTGHSLSLQWPTITNPEAPYDIVRKMRASILILGPLLAKQGYAKVSMPGGCAIGARPINLHLDAMRALGADITLDSGYVIAKTNGRLQGNEIIFPAVSVGATENTLMAACLAKGTTTIRNAACEPEIIDLGHCLQSMGAQIDGLGTPVIRIQGVERLSGCHHWVMSDRIEAGTYAIAAAATKGVLTLHNAYNVFNPPILEIFSKVGIDLTFIPDNDTIQVKQASQGLQPTTLETAPYPGFPTDLQAQMMALMCLTPGTSVIRETIFENRFMHVPELMRLGADIQIQSATTIIRGVEKLYGGPVMATDLRASASLVIAGLAACGISYLKRIYHLDRGYERLEEKLGICGAQITRCPDE